MSVSKYLIYALTDPRDGYVRYVGRSSSGLKRAKEHMQPRLRNRRSYLYRWILSLHKLGLKPGITVLVELSDNSKLNEEEIFYITYLRSLGCQLCNLTDGGDGLLNASEETKRALSLRSKARKGEKRSEEARRNVAIGNKGKNQGPQSPEHIRNKVLANPLVRPIVDNLGRQFESATHAARVLGVGRANINNQLRGRSRTAGGLVFQYVEVSLER